MADVNWRRSLVFSSFVLALMLLAGSLYLHLQQQPHLGRLRLRDGGKNTQKVENNENSDESELTPSTEDALSDTNYDEYDDYGIQNDLATQSLVTEDKGSQEHDREATIQVDDTSDISKLCTEFEALAYADNEQDTSVRNSLQESIAHTALQIATNWQLTADSVTTDRHVTEVCLQCICETTTECQPNTLYRISYPYWFDAGQLRVEGDRHEGSEVVPARNEVAYTHCVNNAYCAARTVSAYIGKNARDCNKDGIIDCQDHIALHILGPTGCVRNELLPVFKSRMHKCLEKFQ